jgi:hypothetical protein
LDPRDLNRGILRKHYPLKTVEEVAATLKDAKVFSTLDAASGFYQIKLSEKSTWVTTFNTLYGRYKFESLPFGISSAPEIFQRTISQIFSDIDGCSTIAADILIYGRNQDELDQRLSAVLARAQEVNLWFNRQKCKFRLSEVNFVGHVFGPDGLKPCQSKVKAIIEMKSQENKKDLHRFLGMINYLGKFIPIMSTVNRPLRQLLEKNIE